jgi:hypothetical protein
MTLLSPVVVETERPGNSPIAKTMRDIRSWLTGERIVPIYLQTVVGNDGLGFEISFRDERDAERFQERFASLLTGAPFTTALETGEVFAALQFPQTGGKIDQSPRPPGPSPCEAL